MEAVYIFFVVVLFVLAISDLIVGVSNDAVNFLNSAIGSKSAPFWVIMIIASFGVLVGATFSSGMMEVARKGIMHPENFLFAEIMVIFLAVMITDILLLDLFNTLGLPTSTTVSIVFELLGASVAVAVIKILSSEEHLDELNKYINSGKALTIIGGILLSVLVAFTLGAISQYITRLVFSFNYKNTLKKFGAVWAGIAVTAITYFILVKGAKGSSFISGETLAWIKSHTMTIILGSFAIWFVIFQILSFIKKINILKIVVLIGTFALAMAFAGNDLVNFIGVPLAGLKSFQEFLAHGSGDPLALSMDVLTKKVQTPTLYLLIAGLVMVVTLWFSRKAKTVTETELNLSRQDEGYERFGSSGVSRAIVRGFISLGKTVDSVTPPAITNFAKKRFDKSKAPSAEDKQSFDLIRASVNLTVASIIISFATSLKLPLSTTYVTFMVAMGTSLSDGAWGRESAVYRVTGVISVITGWFFTAIVAFTAAFIFASIIHWGGIYAVIALIGVGLYILIKAQLYHKSKQAKKQKEGITLDSETTLEDHTVFTQCNLTISNTLSEVSKLYKRTLISLSSEDRKGLLKLEKETRQLNREIKQQKDNVHFTIRKLQDDAIDTGHYYVQALDYLREITHDLTFIVSPAATHIDNNHKGIPKEQVQELLGISSGVQELFESILKALKTNTYTTLEEIIESQRSILSQIASDRKRQIKRIKKGQSVTTRNSLLYLDILAESKNMILNTINLLKAQRDFVIATKQQNMKVEFTPN